VTEDRHIGTFPVLSPVVEGEGWDRKDLTLPGSQLNLIQVGGLWGQGRLYGFKGCGGREAARIWRDLGMGWCCLAFRMLKLCPDWAAALLAPSLPHAAAQAVAKRSSTPIAVVLVHGAPLDVEWLQRSPQVAAILTAWTPGQGAAAIADVLFGDVAPGGRLPVTWHFQNFTAQSDFANMSMRRWPGRTHRYLQVHAGWAGVVAASSTAGGL
jgi:hypothetical protein